MRNHTSTRSKSDYKAPVELTFGKSSQFMSDTHSYWKQASRKTLGSKADKYITFIFVSY